LIPQHLSESADHQTPDYIVEPARQVLGQIDLDPASCREANKVVRATSYFAPPHDGLLKDWDGRVFLNPPGGSLILTKKKREKMKLTDVEAMELAEQWGAESERWKTKSRAVAWWRKLCEEWLGDRAHEAVFVGFSIDVLQASQGEKTWPGMLEFPVCVPEKRIRFVSNGKPGKAPTHGNVIAYLPHGPGDVERFQAVFREIGSVAT
jgi:hypothetical protein